MHLSLLLQRLAGSFLFFGLVNFVLLSFYVSWHRIRASWCRRRRRSKFTSNNHKRPIVLGFFHPYCSAGGGGERVLWKMIQVLDELTQSLPDLKLRLQVVIYTVDTPIADYKTKLLQQVQDRFSIKLVDTKLQILFVHLHQHAHWLQPAKRLSLLVESYGTVALAKVALQKSPVLPDWWIDTTGCAFTFLIAWLWKCRILAYVHYPTISTDMLQLVWEQRPSYNHAPQNTSLLRTAVKLVYYCFFAFLYGLVGSLATTALVNSHWTAAHIRSLWKGAAWRRAIHIVYPPCRDIPLLPSPPSSQQEKQRESTTIILLSIGQFRPEKDHALQLRALDAYRSKYGSSSGSSSSSSSSTKNNIKLVLLGSCRNIDDEQRLVALKDLAKQLEVERQVEFVVNQPYSVVQEWLRQATVGIHTVCISWFFLDALSRTTVTLQSKAFCSRNKPNHFCFFSQLLNI